MLGVSTGKIRNDITSSIQEGERGEFTVYMGSDLLFNRAKLDRFPSEGEIWKLIGEK